MTRTITVTVSAMPLVLRIAPRMAREPSTAWDSSQTSSRLPSSSRDSQMNQPMGVMNSRRRSARAGAISAHFAAWRNGIGSRLQKQGVDSLPAEADLVPGLPQDGAGRIGRVAQDDLPVGKRRLVAHNI